jgi:BirA family biotin operon repressor/biotin-[acetyl-CoA-carboxylase] ligase
VWLSVVLRPGLPPAACSGITLTAGVAVAAAIEQVTGLQPGIKWPNDVLIGGRKVCGILTEIAAEWDKVHHLILGIGINVNQTEGDLSPELRGTAGSLRLASGAPVSRHALCVALLDELANRYPAFQATGFTAARAEWRARSITIGEHVIARSAGGAVTGVAADVDSDGALLIRQDDGAGVRVTSGEVTLRPAEGHDSRPHGPEQED